MILTYTDILGDGKEHKIKAEVTTQHPASSYGMPVIVLPDGNALDLQSWVLLNYKISKSTKKEQLKLTEAVENFNVMDRGIF